MVAVVQVIPLHILRSVICFEGVILSVRRMLMGWEGDGWGGEGLDLIVLVMLDDGVGGDVR